MLSETVWVLREEKLIELKTQRMETELEIKELMEKIIELKEQKKKLSKQIHFEEVRLNTHNKHKGHTNTNTEVYRMFGKTLKELTEEEYKEYYNTRQRVNRQKRKENKELAV